MSTESRRIRVLLADDHSVTRSAPRWPSRVFGLGGGGSKLVGGTATAIGSVATVQQPKPIEVGVINGP